MRAKEYLQQVFKINELIEAKLEQVVRLRELATSATQNKLSKMPKARMQGDKLSDTVARIVDLEQEINEQITELVDIKRDVMHKIDSMPSDTSKLVLTLRYLNLKKWEEVADKLNYDYKHTHRLHGKALKEFEGLYGLAKAV